MYDTDESAGSGDPGESQHNIFIGHQAGSGTWTTNNSDFNVGIGGYALDGALNDCNSNIGIGYEALSAVVSGNKNVAIGVHAMAAADGNEGSNIAIGYKALGQNNNDSGDENTCIGNESGWALTGGADNTFIGSETAGSSVNASNQIVIGKSAIGKSNNSVTLGNGSVTAVYMSQDGDAIMYARGIDARQQVTSLANGSSTGTLSMSGNYAIVFVGTGSTGKGFSVSISWASSAAVILNDHDSIGSITDQAGKICVLKSSGNSYDFTIKNRTGGTHTLYCCIISA
jgi:hypothetical protein